MSEPTKTLHEKLEYIGGCGDGGCIVHVRPGMHTNGGCGCNREPQKMSAVIYWHKRAVASQAAQIERLEKACRAVINSHVDLGSAIRHCHAALQPKEGK